MWSQNRSNELGGKGRRRTESGRGPGEIHFGEGRRVRLGPIPSEARSATWVRSKAAHVALSEAMRRRVDEALTELEEANRGR